MSHCVSLGHCISHHLPWRYICSAKKGDKVRQHNNIKSSTWKASGNPKSLPIRSPQRHIHSTSNQDTFTPFLAFSLPPRTTSNSMGQHVVRNHVLFIGWYAIFLCCHRYSDLPKSFQLSSWCSGQPRFYHLQLSLWAFFDHFHLKVRAFRVYGPAKHLSTFLHFWAKC